MCRSGLSGRLFAQAANFRSLRKVARRRQDAHDVHPFELSSLEEALCEQVELSAVFLQERERVPVCGGDEALDLPIDPRLRLIAETPLVADELTEAR